MELNFKIQRNEDSRLQKIFAKYQKKHLRRQIIEEKIAVNQAHKQALRERKAHRNPHALMVRETLPAKRPPRAVNAVTHRAKKSYYSLHTTVLRAWYTVSDAFAAALRRKSILIAAICAVIIASGASVAYERLFGYEVTFNGYKLGYVRDQADLDAAVRKAETRLAEWYRNDSVYFEHSITTRLSFIGGVRTLNGEGLESLIIECNLPVFANGAVLTVAGVDYLRFGSVADVMAVIDHVKTYGLTINDPSIVSSIPISTVIDQELSYRIITVNCASVSSPAEGIKALSTGGEPPREIATTQLPSGLTKTPQDNREILRSFYVDGINEGSKGLVTALDFRKDDFAISEITTRPMITSTTTREIVYTEPVKYKTTYVSDSKIYAGTTKLVSEGVQGVREVTARVTYVNGKQTAKTVLSETVTREPVNEVMGKGTKPLPSAASTGRFLIPVNGRVSSFGDTRSGSHAAWRAVDIATPTGTQIHASDSGIVVRASWYGDYGQCIIVKHASGYTTLYAHLYKIDCEVGQEVDQLEVIGRVGSTGNSTGPHLHFEIRHNDTRQDLRNYFDYLKEGVRVKYGD